MVFLPAAEETRAMRITGCPEQGLSAQAVGGQGTDPLGNWYSREVLPEGDRTYSLANETLLSRDSQQARITLQRSSHRHGDKLFMDSK